MSYITDNTFPYANASFDVSLDFDYAPVDIVNNAFTGQEDISSQWSNGPMDGIVSGNCATFDHPGHPYSGLPFDLGSYPSNWNTNTFELIPSYGFNLQFSPSACQWDTSTSSTPSLSSGSSSNSAWSWDLSPSSSTTPQTEVTSHPSEIPAPNTHNQQDMLSFLNTIEVPTQPAPEHKRTRRAGRSRQERRACAPRVACPNFPLCGKTFSRKDVLARHLKNTCGVQCESCAGTLPVGVACMHHRGSGRPVASERIAGGWARAAPY